MWHDFKRTWCILFFASFSFAGVAQQTSGLIYDLRQNWVQYDKEVKSFMPAVSQTVGNSVSFKIDNTQFASYLLFIQNNEEAHLFYKNKLLTKLNVGSHYFKIDSLRNSIHTNDPLLTVYGNKIKDNVVTLIVDKEFESTRINSDETHAKNNPYTSFFILSSILLLIGLVFTKLLSHDLFAQYTNFSRVFGFITIDEVIYKGRFFGNPSIQIIIWMSTSAAFVLYFLLIKLNTHFLDLSWVQNNSILFHMLHLGLFALGFLVFFALRFLIINIMASIFDMGNTKNIHFASHLRLTFLLLLVLQSIITLEYFSVIHLNSDLFLFIVFVALFAIIVLIGIRLSFIIRHPFVQIFLYLCGTEIFLFVFVYKLVVG